ncbi:MAG TPA: glycosyltransferase family 39 protein [Bryobacteraceae bacterium]|nr:glycosyltransferase family 39 protein [Bryobacteraceae bacterium]
MNARFRFPLLALAAAILFLGAIRLGDLAGYDDAMFSLEAKGIVKDGDWLTPKARGMATMEHPPLFVWSQAALLEIFGISDPVAKLPPALCGLGIVLLVYWLARRLLDDSLAASVAMFVMLATPYFIKYAARAMSDVPTAFLFLCAISAWVLAEENPLWFLAAGAFTAMALMVRGLIGFALPLIFATQLIVLRRRPQWRYMVPAAAIAIAPIAAWYCYLFFRYRSTFTSLHEGWLDREVFGSLTPAWRRYTGAFEYCWMLAKSYWPWLPPTIAGIVIAVREKRRPLYLLLCWIAGVFVLCAAARSRVLRYMLPAYPAFAVLAAVGIVRWTPRRVVERVMLWIPPAAVVAAACLVMLIPPVWHATEIRSIAQAEDRVLPPGEYVGLYDQGDPRYDETNQLEWYGHVIPVILPTREDLEKELRAGKVRVYLIDQATYRERFAALPHDVIAEEGHLVSIRLKPPTGADAGRAGQK